MRRDINSLKIKTLSPNLEDAIGGIEQLSQIIEEISTVFIESLSISKDRFIIAEKLSSVFSSFIDGLNAYLDSQDVDLRFWAATLIIHYNLNNVKAERILLDAIKVDNIEKAQVATSILCRNNNSKVKNVIYNLLKQEVLDEKSKQFFVEKIEDLVNFGNKSK